MDRRFLTITKTIKEANVKKLGKMQVEGAPECPSRLTNELSEDNSQKRSNRSFPVSKLIIKYLVYKFVYDLEYNVTSKCF